MLAHKGFGGLFLGFKQDKGLLFTVHLKKLGVYNGAIFPYVGHNLLLGHVLWEGR